jgi:predicted ArsR family transcriptional regulator
MTEQRCQTPATGFAGFKPSRPGGKSKMDILHSLLSRRHGATVAQVQQRLGWQPHTVRAAISRLRASGLTIELDRSGKVPRYRSVVRGDL